MRVLVGKILKPQGIKGEVKVASAVGAALIRLKYLYIDNLRASVENARSGGEFVYIKLSTVNDRSHAETLRNKELFADRSDVTLDYGSYLIDEIVGSRVVFEDGVYLGELTEVMQNSKAADVFVVKTQKGEVLFPFIKTLVVSVNSAENVITVNYERFKQSALTEDSEEIK